MFVYAENNVDITTTRGIILLRPIGHNSDNAILSPIINFYLLNPPNLFKVGKKTKELPSWYPLHTGLQKTTLFRASSLASCSSSWFVFPSHWLHFSCFPTSSGAYFPFDRLKNDWEEPVLEPLLKGTTQAFFHFTTISHRVIKSRTDDSIHSWSSAAKVESRWHHWRCELVPAVFLDHLGFCNKIISNST